MAALLRRYGTFVAVALIVGYFWVELPSTFLTGRNLLNISQQMSMLAVVATTMTVVMAMGDFDLSVGSMASLSGIVAALVFISGGSAPLAVGAALLAGLAGGVVNGALVAYVGILPFIATLGAMTVFSGLAFKLSGGRTLFGDAIPHVFSDFARGGVPLFSTDLLIPNLTLIAGATVAAAWILLEQTVVGRRLYAIGGNAEAARLAGVPVRSLRLAAFGIAGSLGKSDARRWTDAGRNRRRLPRAVDDRRGRAAGDGDCRRRLDPRDHRQWSYTIERRFIRPRRPNRLDCYRRSGGQQLRKDTRTLTRDPGQE
jgi:ribose transport system permease protein